MAKKIFSGRGRIVAGLLAGVLLVGVGFNGVQAAVNAANQTGEAAVKQVENKTVAERMPFEMNADEAAKHIHDQFGVDQKEVRAALTEHRDFHDVGQAAMLAQISGKSFSDVLALKTDQNTWQDVGQQIGVTREQVRAQMDQMFAQRISQSGDVTVEKALALLNNGYCGYDIAMAGHLATASGKDIQSVLDLKKINNRWEDVAEELGLSREEGSPRICGPRDHRMEADMMSDFVEPAEDNDNNQ